MILVAYACLLVATMAFARNAPVGVSGRIETPVRVLAGAVGLGFTSLGAVLLGNGLSTTLGIALATMLVVGGLTFAWGVVRWRAAGALVVRRLGWILVVVALAVPSTLTLLLPLACLLLPTVYRTDAQGPRHLQSQ